MIRLAEQNNKICAITAAMSTGTGLDGFGEKFPDRFFDVGIAEGHALTFAAGLAAHGMRPVCALYSTFLQRAVDQMIHDIALQNLPVTVAIDRAGLVGEDGATHQGAFDFSYLRFIPNFTIMAPADENELQHMLATSLTLSGPVAIRYPRGSGTGIALDAELQPLPVGKGEIKREGKDVFIVAIGNTVYPALEAAQLLASSNISCGVANMRFLKPFDDRLILSLLDSAKRLVVIEENSVLGGLNSAVSELLVGRDVKILKIGLPDSFIEHGHPSILREKYGLTSKKIAEQIRQWMKQGVESTQWKAERR